MNDDGDEHFRFHVTTAWLKRVDARELQHAPWIDSPDASDYSEPADVYTGPTRDSRQTMSASMATADANRHQNDLRAGSLADTMGRRELNGRTLMPLPQARETEVNELFMSIEQWLGPDACQEETVEVAALDDFSSSQSLGPVVSIGSGASSASAVAVSAGSAAATGSERRLGPFLAAMEPNDEGNGLGQTEASGNRVRYFINRLRLTGPISLRRHAGKYVVLTMSEENLRTMQYAVLYVDVESGELDNPIL
ncbi:unnamed protein product [Protopolystoma xenopodis]|uniref:Uncharacterized protein n=1 Tax=Protopolystoma xenopodis TaxID=117903 RepID=A0A3S4ZUW6_9PLAT|nr:unnamed protein product [Protopolystoma xenopodis]